MADDDEIDINYEKRRADAEDDERFEREIEDAKDELDPDDLNRQIDEIENRIDILTEHRMFHHVPAADNLLEAYRAVVRSLER